MNELEKALKINREKDEKIARLEQENELLRQKVDLLVRKVFGKSSEQLDLNQLLLFEDDKAKKPEGDAPAPADELSPEAPAKKPRAIKRPRKEATLPENLPVEETVLIPDEVEANPDNYRQVGEEVTTKLDYQPAQFRKLVTRRPQFIRRLHGADDNDNGFCIAPLPPALKERSLLTPSLAAEIATNRFCDHQPYYRQEQHFLMRHGVHLGRSTMSQWMGDLARDYLRGIYDAMHSSMLRVHYLQVDETPIDYLEPGNGSTRQGYLWTLSCPEHPKRQGENNRGDIFYQWHSNRAAESLKSLLQSGEDCFKGILQSDGYQAYETYQAKSEGIELIACWAHVRRKFYEARDQKPKLSGWILRQIRALYAIESRLRESRAGPAERERVRLWQSLPIYRRLGKALQIIRIKKRILPKSNLGNAIDYALNQWPKLDRCFTDGRLEIDNNLVENGIRPTKLGAKNWLFMGSEAAGETNAIWYTIIESCRRRKVDPWKYLVWIFEELPRVKVTRGTFASYTPRAYAQKLRDQQRATEVS